MRRRPPRPAKVRPNKAGSTKAGRGEAARRGGDSQAEIVQLRRELEEARARLREVEERGADAFLARRLAELEEGRQVARGQAVEATVAKSRAEAELRALRDAIARAPGVWGWLLRRAQRRLDER